MKKLPLSKATSAGKTQEKKLQTSQFDIIDSIKKSKNKLFLAITGGGTQAISNILKGGGASSVFVGAIVPYHQEMLRDVVGSFDKAVSIKIARGLSASFPEVELEKGQSLISIGCTSSLAKAEPEREGRVHHVCLSVKHCIMDKSGYLKATQVESMSVQLKGSRNREEEEKLVSRLIEAYACCYMNLTKWHPITYPVIFKWIGLTQDDVILTHTDGDINALQDA